MMGRHPSRRSPSASKDARVNALRLAPQDEGGPRLADTGYALAANRLLPHPRLRRGRG